MHLTCHHVLYKSVPAALKPIIMLEIWCRQTCLHQFFTCYWHNTMLVVLHVDFTMLVHHCEFMVNSTCWKCHVFQMQANSHVHFFVLAELQTGKFVAVMTHIWRLTSVSFLPRLAWQLRRQITRDTSTDPVTAWPRGTPGCRAQDTRSEYTPSSYRPWTHCMLSESVSHCKRQRNSMQN